MHPVLLPLLFAAFGGIGPDLDYADGSQRNAWLRHSICGDPSFDTFERVPGNPIHRGAPPYEWPVNGYLFEDPRSGDWFVYAGLYAKNYAMQEDLSMRCIVYRSSDRGASWKLLGCPFPDEPFRFDPDTSPVGHAPDVSVVYADGRYHMIYDWASVDSHWQTTANPEPPADNGVGYAWAERPEGPFTRTSPAVYRTGKSPLRLGKYRRGYAASLVRRERDWMVLFMMDSGPHFGWALFGTVAPRPEGPYSEPIPLRTVEGNTFHPPLLEFFPAFQHGDHVYAPATSVALNRDFQCVFRAPVEKAHLPESWELFQCGSVWHGEPVPNEYYGIWGQTFSGFVDKMGTFNIMFPSRDPEGLGTINLAHRPWNQPYRDRGFSLSGHQGPSLALLKRSYTAFTANVRMRASGEVALLWGCTAPLGPNKPAADAALHDLCATRQIALCLTADTWRVTETGDKGSAQPVASGGLSGPPEEVMLSVDAAGATLLHINGSFTWKGTLNPGPGVLGIRVSPHSSAEVSRFSVSGTFSPAIISYLSTEAIIGAGAAHDTWKNCEQPEFRHGLGAVSLKAGARAKWNVEGSRFDLWSPTGPDYGTATVLVDGAAAGALDFSSTDLTPSHIVWTSKPLTEGPHAVVLVTAEKPIPLDTLDATSGADE